MAKYSDYERAVVAKRTSVGDDAIVEYPMLIIWQSDLDRFRRYAIKHRIPDSGAMLRHVMDVVEEAAEQ